MFTTFRSDANSRLQVDSQQPAHHLSKTPACESCHSKKLRCTRERKGCRRCVSLKVSCKYESSRPKGGRVRILPSAATTRNHSSEVGPNQWNAPRVEVQPLVFPSSDIQNQIPGGLTDDAAMYSPRFSIDSNFLDFLFQDPSSQAQPYKAGNIESSQSETASEDVSQTAQSKEGQSSCQCLALAVSLLESISIQHVQATLRSVPQIIRHNKSGLLQCRALQTCNICSKKSEFVMLLIILCQKIIMSYQRTVIILTEQFNRLHRPNQDSTVQLSIPSMEAAMATAREVDLREYEVEVEEEPCVFGGVVQMQVKKMTSFLETLKAVLKRNDWHSHTAMLDLVEEDVKELLRLCTCPERF